MSQTSREYRMDSALVIQDDFERLLADSVSEGLTLLLGERPSQTVWRSIVKRLYMKLGLQFVEKSNYGFLEYLREARMKH